MHQIPFKPRSHHRAFTLPKLRGRISAFTLIEMLVVIVIISILLVAVIPAVNSLSKSSGSKAAVSNFMNTVEQARTLAITSGSPTYIVFADQTTPENYRAKAYIVFQDKNFIPVAVSKWYFLPTGISFQPGTGLLTPQDESNPPLINFLCPGTIGSTAIPLPFIKFDPSGMVLIPTDSAKMFVKFFSGSVDSSGTSSFTDSTQKTSGNLDQVTISRFTGRPKYVNPYSPS